MLLLDGSSFVDIRIRQNVVSIQHIGGGGLRFLKVGLIGRRRRRRRRSHQYIGAPRLTHDVVCRFDQHNIYDDEPKSYKKHAATQVFRRFYFFVIYVFVL